MKEEQIDVRYENNKYKETTNHLITNCNWIRMTGEKKSTQWFITKIVNQEVNTRLVWWGVERKQGYLGVSGRDCVSGDCGAVLNPSKLPWPLIPVQPTTISFCSTIICKLVKEKLVLVVIFNRTWNRFFLGIFHCNWQMELSSNSISSI